jgi:hypothetical protein
MFGGISESEYGVPYAHYPQRTQRPPSPSLTAQRLIREQQVRNIFCFFPPQVDWRILFTDLSL